LVLWGLEKDYKKRPTIDDILNMPEISLRIRK